jgi:hypothetical protein
MEDTMKTIALAIAALAVSTTFASAAQNSASNPQMTILPAPGHIITVDGIPCLGSVFDRKVWCSAGYGYVVLGRDIPANNIADGALK